jgi:flagella basal body P-ring formation protein FlgA
LIGKTPKRILMAGQAVGEEEIEAPVLVARGEMVTIFYQNGSLTLTSTGKALESGAMGERIRIASSNNNSTIQAAVSGSREVKMDSF